jgi:hypothetical protein
LRYFDDEGDAFFVNTATGETSFEEPESFHDAEPGDARTEVVEQAVGDADAPSRSGWQDDVEEEEAVAGYGDKDAMMTPSSRALLGSANIESHSRCVLDSSNLVRDKQSTPAWMRFFDSSGDAYYFNTATQTTTWDEPNRFVDGSAQSLLRADSAETFDAEFEGIAIRLHASSTGLQVLQGDSEVQLYRYEILRSWAESSSGDLLIVLSDYSEVSFRSPYSSRLCKLMMSKAEKAQIRTNAAVPTDLVAPQQMSSFTADFQGRSSEVIIGTSDMQICSADGDLHVDFGLMAAWYDHTDGRFTIVMNDGKKIELSTRVSDALLICSEIKQRCSELLAATQKTEATDTDDETGSAISSTSSYDADFE